MKNQMITRRRAVRTLANAGAASLVVSISARALGLSAWAKAPQKIVIGTLPISANVTSYIGSVDYFKDEGLNIELSHSQAGPLVLEGMIAGSVAVGDVGLAPALTAITRGLPMLSPYLGAFETPAHPFERIMVREDSPIKKLEDLKGKKIAINGRGTNPDLMLSAIGAMTKGKTQKKDLKIVLIPPPNQPAALAKGLVDAIFAIPPSDLIAEHRYKARTLVNATDLVPYFGFATVMIRRDFTETYPEATKNLFKAWIKFSRWIRDKEGAARVAVAKNLGLPHEIASDQRIPLFARNGLPVMPNVWHVYYMLLRAKTIHPHPNPEKLIADTVVEPAKKFVLPALEELGWATDNQIKAMLKAYYPLLPKPDSTYYADWERRLLKV